MGTTCAVPRKLETGNAQLHRPIDYSTCISQHPSRRTAPIEQQEIQTMSEHSQTAANKPSEPVLCKSGCGFFVSGKLRSEQLWRIYSYSRTDLFRNHVPRFVGSSKYFSNGTSAISSRWSLKREPSSGVKNGVSSKLEDVRRVSLQLVVV